MSLSLASSEAGEHREAEGKGLTGAGLTATEYVPASDGIGQGGSLDGERFEDPAGLEDLYERRINTEFEE